MTTTNDLVIELMQRLNEPAGRYGILEAYYEGRQPLAFLSPEARIALGNRFGRIASNIPRLAVTALAERLRITGFSDPTIWPHWLRNDMDQLSGVAHREALLLGDAFVWVWADSLGRPKSTIESARQVAVQIDPGTREITAAVKRWETKTTTEGVLLLPDRIVRLRAEQTGATVHGYKEIDTMPNPLGVVPVVALRNSDRILDDRGSSEVDDLMPLVDGLNKSLCDMLVASEYTARPRRWAVGVELTEEEVLDEHGLPTGETVEVNPIPEGSRAMVSENESAKFGQLPGADLIGYETAVNVLLSQIMAVSALPAHYIGALHDQPTSADSLRAAEASLAARAEDRQRLFGRSWEQVAKLIVAVRDGRTPDQIDDIQVYWADAATRSVGQEMDAVVKAVQAGILPITFALKKLGYSDAEIEEIRAARRLDALDTAAVDLRSIAS